MSQLLPIISHPDPTLKKVSIPITVIDDFIKVLVPKMFETMYHSKGIGLSAIQVGVPLRLFIMDTGNNPLIFINPEITAFSKDSIESEEGCLSFYNIFTKVPRYSSIEMSALDADLQPFKITLMGIEAQCAQHELDHLNGITMIDHLSKLKREMLEKKLLKQKRLVLHALQNVVHRGH